MDSTQPRWVSTSYDLSGTDYSGTVYKISPGWVAYITFGDISLNPSTELGTFPSSYEAKQAVEKAVWNRTYQAVTHA